MAGRVTDISRDELVARAAAAEESRIRAARESLAAFNAYVLRDDLGRASLVPGKIHLSWSRHLETCRAARKYPAIVAPWGHGKTEQVVIGGTLFDIGRNPQIRIKIICNSDANAQARIGSIRRYIESSEEYRRVFPDVEPDRAAGWSGHRLFLKREGHSKDPSVEAWGVGGSGVGGRADKLVFDDPVDFKNSVQEPKSRETLKDYIRQAWMSRLDVKPGVGLNYNQIEWISTVWHERDATCDYVMKNPEFSVLLQSIAEPDMDAIECRAWGRTWRIPLWDAKWDGDELRRRRRQIGERAYARGFLNRPYSDEDMVLSSFGKRLRYDLSPAAALAELGSDWRFVTGVDPAGGKRAGFAIVTIAVERTKHIRVPVDVRVGAWKGRQPIDQCLEVQRMWKPEVFVVENNAVQERFRGWLDDAGAGDGILTKPFVTGNNKADVEAGIPGLGIEFENKLWVIPLAQADHRLSPECACAWCRLIREVTLWPMYESSDLLMAAWFAREFARGGRSMAELLSLCQSDGRRGAATGTGGNIAGQIIPREMRPMSARGSTSGKILAMKW